MSATNRGAERRMDDFYTTPAWCVHALLREVHLPGGTWLEPACGDGAIVEAVKEIRQDVCWTAFDIRERKLCLGSVRDYLDRAIPVLERPAVIITNPPFSLAREFVERSFEVTDGPVVMLLRLNWLASQKRAEFLREHAPDVYVLPRRPSFTGDKRTDACEYAWYIWSSRMGRSHGVVRVLDASRERT
jgi:hypothetical protein